MIPIVTPEEMGAIDAAAPEPVEILIGRAGSAVARAAVRLLGGTYGRRVVVLAGKGNNGNDGRDAARRLRRRGMRVHVLDAADLPEALPACDLVIDAAYGTGFRGEWDGSDRAGSGARRRHPVRRRRADRVDARPGPDRGPHGDLRRAQARPAARLRGPTGPARSTWPTSASTCPGRRTHLVEGADVAGWLPRRAADGHKWQAAVRVVAGSPGMTGAAHLTSAAAFRAGAGYVTLSSPGVDHDPTAPTEVVGRPLPAARLGRGGARAMRIGTARWRSVPGLGTGPEPSPTSGRWWRAGPGPWSSTATASPRSGETVADVTASRSVPAVLTPHEGEFARLAGGPSGATGSPPSVPWPRRPAPWSCSRARRRSSPPRTARC